MAPLKRMFHHLSTLRGRRVTQELALGDGLTPDGWLRAVCADSELSDDAKVTAAAMASFMRSGEVVTVTTAELAARACELDREARRDAMSGRPNAGARARARFEDSPMTSGPEPRSWRREDDAESLQTCP